MVNNSIVLKYYSCDVLKTRYTHLEEMVHNSAYQMPLLIVLVYYIINKCFASLLLLTIITHILSTCSGWGSAGTGRCIFMILMEITSSYWLSTLCLKTAFLLIITVHRASLWNSYYLGLHFRTESLDQVTVKRSKEHLAEPGLNYLIFTIRPNS